jgi:RNase H-fold protein (predicted Holliday junction resolvase)
MDLALFTAKTSMGGFYAKGKAVVINDDEERLLALKSLMKKYQPEGVIWGLPARKTRHHRHSAC